MDKKYLKKDKGLRVYSSKLGRGKITLIENGIVHVQFDNGKRARYDQVIGANAAGEMLHKFDGGE